MIRDAGDRGSATLWVLSGCVLLFLAGAVASARTEAVLARHRAETAADLAALAAATRLGTGGDPCAAAQPIAAANGARLAGCRVRPAPGGRGGTVDVSVAVAVQLPVIGSRQVLATGRAGRQRAATSIGQVSQHEVEQRDGAGLVERLVAVAALG